MTVKIMESLGSVDLIVDHTEMGIVPNYLCNEKMRQRLNLLTHLPVRVLEISMK